MDTEMFQWHQFINYPSRLSCAFQSITVVFGFGLANITAPLLEIKCFIITFVFQYHQTIMNRIFAFAYTWSRWNKAATLRHRGAVIEMSGVVKIFFFSVKRVFAWKLGETFETTVLQLTRERLKKICFMPPALPNNEISQTWLHFCSLLVLTFILMAGWKPFMCLFKYHTSWWFHYYITTTLGNRSIHKPVSSTNKWNRYHGVTATRL